MSQKMRLGIPDDNDLLEAIGRLTVAHSNLEMVQIMWLKTLEKSRPHEALSKHRTKAASIVRKRIEQLISDRAAASEKDHVTRVKELLLDARCHSKRRNALIHRFFGIAVDGTWRTSGDESRWEGVPSIEVINDLVDGILKTTSELNAERRENGLFTCV